MKKPYGEKSAITINVMLVMCSVRQKLQKVYFTFTAAVTFMMKRHKDQLQMMCSALARGVMLVRPASGCGICVHVWCQACEGPHDIELQRGGQHLHDKP